MNKHNKVKLAVFSGIIILAAILNFTHTLPYKAIWLWFPVLVFVDNWLDQYAKKRGLIISDEMIEQRTEKSAWAAFQATIALIFLSIVYYEYSDIFGYRWDLIDPRFLLAYIAGFMGITFIAVNLYYRVIQGELE